MDNIYHITRLTYFVDFDIHTDSDEKYFGDKESAQLHFDTEIKSAKHASSERDPVWLTLNEAPIPTNSKDLASLLNGEKGTAWKETQSFTNKEGLHWDKHHKGGSCAPPFREDEEEETDDGSH